jgi:predicted exporter
VSHKIDTKDMKKLLHPAIALWLLFSLICGFFVSQSKFTADMSAFLPREPSARQQILIDQISEGFASRSLIVGIEGVPESTLAQLSISMVQKLRAGNDFSNISNGQVEANQTDQEFIFANRYVLSPRITPDRMTVKGLQDAVEDTLAEVSSSTGLFSKSLLARDPTGESLEIIKRVIPANQPANSGGVWMNASLSRALILLQTTAQGSDLDAQQVAQAAVEQSFIQAKAKVGTTADNAILKFSGPGVFAVKARDTIKTEAARLSTIGIILVLSLLWLIYRSVMTLFLGVLPVVTGAVAGIAAVGLGFSSVHGMTLGFGITLIGEAVDYAIYLFVQYTPSSRMQAGGGQQVQEKGFTSSFWTTIRLGVITSIFGFSTLLFSGFTGLAQLGLFSIVGIVVAAVVTRFVLPILLPLSFSVRQPKKLGFLLAKVAQNLYRCKGFVIILAAVAVIFLVLRWDTLWSTELGGLSPVPEAAQRLDSELRADMGAPDAGVLIVLKATSSEQALQLSEAVAARLEGLVAKGDLSGFQAPSNYLPSQRTQIARKANLPENSELQRRAALALEKSPLKPNKLGEFFLDVATAKNSQLLVPSSLKGTSMSLGVDSLLMHSAKTPSSWTALIALQAPVRDSSQTSINIKSINAALIDIGQEKENGVYVIELKNEASDVYKAYLREAITLSSAGLFAILLLLILVLRSVRRVIQVFTPLLASVVIVASVVVLLKGSLSLLHLVGLLLVIAIGSNYALFFDQRTRSSAVDTCVSTDHNMLCSLLFANLTTILGFGLLAFSSVPVMNAIGFTVGTGTFLALVLSAAFARPFTINATV